MLATVSKAWIRRINQYNELRKGTIGTKAEQDEFERKWMEIGEGETGDKTRKNWSMFDDWLDIFEDITPLGTRDEMQLLYPNVDPDKLLGSRIN